MDEKPAAFATRLQSLTDTILGDYEHGRVIDRLEMFTQPDSRVIHELIGKLMRLVFPGYYLDLAYRIYNPKNSLSTLVEDVAFHLNRQIAIALRNGAPETGADTERQAETITRLTRAGQDVSNAVFAEILL